jgi:hypothetical protein
MTTHPEVGLNTLAHMALDVAERCATKTLATISALASTPRGGCGYAIM